MFRSASVVICTLLSGILWLTMGLGQHCEAAESSTHAYFLNEIEPDHTMLVSPNFDGDLSLQPLWESLTEISETYDIKGAQVLYSNWPNVREVPRLLVQVERKANGIQSAGLVADGSAIAEHSPS